MSIFVYKYNEFMFHSGIPKIFAASIIILFSCSNDNAGGIEYKYIDTDSSIKAGVDTWPAKVFVFRNGSCISIQDVTNLASLSEIDAQPGDSVATIAYENLDNLSFSPSVTGEAAEKYSLTVLNPSEGTKAGIWFENSIVNSSDDIVSQSLRPISSNVTFNVTGADDLNADASLTLKGILTQWNFASESGTDGDASGSITLTDGNTYSILPMQDPDTGFVLDLEININDREITPDFTMPQGVGEGQDVTFTLDLSNYGTSRSYTVSCTVTDISSGKSVLSLSKDFVDEENEEDEESKTSILYKVYVEKDGEWEEMTVHNALCSDSHNHPYIWNDWNNSKALRDTMSYCIFEDDFTGPVKIRVENLSGSFTSAQVRPSTYGINATSVNGNAIEFSIPSYDMHKVSVEFDEDRQHNLFIYGYKPDSEKPSADSSSIIYYGPGEHDAGTITLNEGQTLYIDYGAVVYGNVVANGSNVTIAGHGVLSGEKMQHWGDSQYSYGDFLVRCNKSNAEASNLEIRDITMIDSPGWNLCITSMNDVTIKGVNMISWELNGDGIDIVCCTGVDISDCFIRTYDDCISLKCRFIVTPITDVSDVVIHDNLIWPDYARGVVVGPEAGNTKYSGHLHDITVEDCIFLQHGRALSDDLRAAFAIGQGSDGSTSLWNGTNPPQTINAIKADNLTFDDIDPSGRAISIRQYGGSPKVTMSDITLSNIEVISNKSGEYPALTIYTNGSKISGMKISGFTFNGQAITGIGEQFTIDTPSNVDYIIE